MSVLTTGLVFGLEGKNVVQISAGNYHCMALTEEGQVYAWGLGDHGALGLGTRDDVYVDVGLANLQIETYTCPRGKG